MEESLLKAEWDIVFRKRMEAHFDEMKWLYGELYHNDSRAFSYFCAMLYQYYQSRSGEL